MEDQSIITAQHECAHALAYVAHDLDFLALDVSKSIVAVPPRHIDPWQGATIALAGPMVDLRYVIESEGLDDAIQWRLMGWEDSVANAEDEGEHDGNDEFYTNGLLAGGAPWAYAFVMTNWQLIRELAEAVGDAAISYPKFIDLLGSRRPIFNIDAVSVALEIWGPHHARLQKLDDRISDLSQRA